ncbi:tetratricopeptide repeat protein [Iodidimonas sp. SYSU 1G8]|uniref:tetratricopeptide repeat protein n=1 Tax=Iodidimonas sp. SYSU 1G8 TaxID=3133967 RepID=UPI0031FEC77D
MGIEGFDCSRATRVGRRLILCGAVAALSACQHDRAPAAVDLGPPPDTGVVAMMVADAADRAGDTASAADLYGQAISEGKAGPRAYLRRGEILLSMGRAQDAASVFQQALKGGIDTPDIRRGRARALLALGQAGPALQEYDSLLIAEPADVRSMNGRGVALDILQRHAEAQAQYRAAADAAPGDMSVQNNLALSYALTGRTEEAIDILERIDAAGASTVQHRQNLALLYGLTGQVPRAEALATRDLGEEAARKNLDVYARMRHLLPGPVEAASGNPVAPALQDAKSQAWVIDLGAFALPQAAADHWNDMRRIYPEPFAGLAHYVEKQADESHLVAGPFWNEARAREICGRLEADGRVCVIRLSDAPPPA